ncbi:hypothetical protein CYMTET_6589 [Cymbomonas tetramitiformis]|uniref:Uncharacterized protein n=1 Tax=Cymbomonas tetramitiformis TaxID=36881 RepID=A0AAE0GWU7_9CHLO|nr:hypothetical protein CYMTET_6589 [Cymbomonas tetramitiformis]
MADSNQVTAQHVTVISIGEVDTLTEMAVRIYTPSFDYAQQLGSRVPDELAPAFDSDIYYAASSGTPTWRTVSVYYDAGHTIVSTITRQDKQEDSDDADRDDVLFWHSEAMSIVLIVYLVVMGTVLMASLARFRHLMSKDSEELCVDTKEEIVQLDKTKAIMVAEAPMGSLSPSANKVHPVQVATEPTPPRPADPDSSMTQQGDRPSGNQV